MIVVMMVIAMMGHNFLDQKRPTFGQSIMSGRIRDKVSRRPDQMELKSVRSFSVCGVSFFMATWCVRKPVSLLLLTHPVSSSGQTESRTVDHKTTAEADAEAAAAAAAT